jgi:membrane-associated phospholipid phosphatase
MEQRLNQPTEVYFARILTYIFHPLLIPTYGMILLYKVFSRMYFLDGDPRIFWLLLGITLITTCLLPAMSSYILLRSGMLKSLEMNERRERILPYLTTAMYYLFAFYMLRDFPVPAGMLTAMRLFTLGGAAAIVGTMVINFYWKISAHTVAIGGLIGAVLALSMLLPMVPPELLYIVLLLGGIVGYARLRLDAHSPAQVYAGYLLGFLSTFLLLLFV